VAKPDPLPAFNLRAYLEGPVREAAEVYVNGQRAGVVWHPPCTIDVTTMLKTGRNELRIVVGNTAINSLASRALPDYRLLNDRYGELVLTSAAVMASRNPMADKIPFAYADDARKALATL